MKTAPPPGRSDSNNLPKWLHFEPCEDLGTCSCTEVIGARHYALSTCGTCLGAGVVRARPILSAHELATPLRADFGRTAAAMREDLEAEGWAQLPNTRPERWRSPERKRVLPLADAWVMARADAAGAQRAAPVVPTRVDRSAEFDQSGPDDFNGGADVHRDSVVPPSASEKVTA